MSLCDRCFAPGQCCRDINLSTPTHDQVTVWAEDDPTEALRQMMPAPMPFVPLSVQGEWTVPEGEADAGRVYRSYRWTCTALAPDGRCSIYEERPQLCRSFEAGSDPLCVHWQGAESDERSVL